MRRTPQALSYSRSPVLGSSKAVSARSGSIDSTSGFLRRPATAAAGIVADSPLTRVSSCVTVPPAALTAAFAALPGLALKVTITFALALPLASKVPVADLAPTSPPAPEAAAAVSGPPKDGGDQADHHKGDDDPPLTITHTGSRHRAPHEGETRVAACIRLFASALNGHFGGDAGPRPASAVAAPAQSRPAASFATLMS